MKFITIIKNFFVKPKEVESLKIVPCSYIQCSECIYFNLIDQKCGITEDDIKNLNSTFTINDIDKFKRW